MAKKRVLILGGGFGGVYVAKALEKLRADRDEFEIALINKDNYFVYQPMLAEIISGHVGIFDTVSPLRSLLRKTDVIVRDVESVDLANKRVITSPGFKPVKSEYPYDYLVLALGNVTDFRGLTGLTQHALRFKYLSDALTLRNHVIRTLEEASVETNPKLKEALLTFVVAGGGWSGVECVAEMNDFVRNVARKYRNVDPKQVRMVLLQSDTRILREMDESLAIAAQDVMRKNGIEIRLETRLAAATGDEAVLNTGERIPSKTLVSTVPGSPNPVIEALNLPKGIGRGGKSNHRIKVGLDLQVEGSDHIWAIGDCAQIPEPGDTTGEKFCPPTAQHAVREGELAAHNIVAAMRGGQKKLFGFKGLGQMGVFGHHSAVAQMTMGGMKLNFKGYLAWLMWRGVYVIKLPGWDRQVRTLTAWFTASFLPTDTVQLTMRPQAGIVQEHYEPGQYVFNQGDLGDRLFIIIKGKAEVIKTENRVSKRLAELEKGQYFGEMALLREGQHTRGAAVRAMEPLDVLSVPRQDIVSLVEYMPALRESFQDLMDRRDQENKGLPPPPADHAAVNPMEETVYIPR